MHVTDEGQKFTSSCSIASASVDARARAPGTSMRATGSWPCAPERIWSATRYRVRERKARARRWRIDWRISVAALGGGIRNLDARVESRVLRPAAPRDALQRQRRAAADERRGCSRICSAASRCCSADSPEMQVQVGVGAQFPVYRRLADGHRSARQRRRLDDDRAGRRRRSFITFAER